MTEAERSNTVREAYVKKHGSKKETSDILKEDKPPKDPTSFSMAEGRQWFIKEDIGALKQQPGFNSYVPPSNDHELQVDLFEYKNKQPKRFTVKP